MIALLKFELGSYFKRPGIYIALFLLLITGVFIGFKLSVTPGNQVYRNSAYSIASMVGLLSLTTIFTATLFAAQVYFKEADAKFSLIIYATPLTPKQYLLSRFGTVWCLCMLCFTALVSGYVCGHLADADRQVYQPFHLWFYVQPVLLLALPNVLLCCVLTSAIACLTRNKLMVYVGGLLLYMAYLIVLTYSGSPMMAGGLPQSAQAMALAARVDPFGLSAFYQQTTGWTITQKNTALLQLTGNLLLNRLGYVGFAVMLFALLLLKFKLQIKQGTPAKRTPAPPTLLLNSPIYRPVAARSNGFLYMIKSCLSLVQQDLRVVVKSIPFVLIALGIIFYMSMEFYGSIDQGIRLPQQYASTGLIANRIIYNLPGLLLLVGLFYAHELYWRSAGCRFTLIENSTPVAASTLLLAKLVSLAAVLFLLITLTILTGLVFQFVFQCPIINWAVYGMLYWLIGLPLLLCAALILWLQRIINRQWLGLGVTCIVLLILTSAAGKTLGLNHPLLRFAAAYPARYSEMNGWDDYLRSFSWRMLYGCSLISLLWLLTIGTKKSGLLMRLATGLVLAVCLATGIYIYHQTPINGPTQELDRRQAYEQHYRQYQGMNQPVITVVKTFINLNPTHNAYQLKGTYLIRNTGNTAIHRLLVNVNPQLSTRSLTYRNGSFQSNLTPHTGLHPLEKPLLPGDSAYLTFSASYHWSGFTGHESFNAIVHNGSFMRISNYFPTFGYQADEEINSPAERRKRHLGNPMPLLGLNAPRGKSEFIDLDLTVATPSGQTVVGTGQLVRSWQLNGKNYFRYRSVKPIPFRFGISSAAYAVQRVKHNRVEITVYYDPKHSENVRRLIANAARALDYCQTNFGAYPYPSISFAEVSSFTDGFAGTAYPATIFMTEHLLFHDNLKAAKNQDVINELAAHELSHQWWGTGQLAPDEREGAKVLTETLAMYTELMLAKHTLGNKAVQEKLALHRRMYLDERGFTRETPLQKATPDDTHLYYSKGALVMYRLSELLGEQKVNQALIALLNQHRYPNPPPVATDLLNELYKVSDPSVHATIYNLFNKPLN